MPNYDYKCPNCDFRFERYQGIKEKPVKVCPRCGSKKVQRLIGAGGGIIFKGSGFYCNDYGKGKNPIEKKDGEGKK